MSRLKAKVGLVETSVEPQLKMALQLAVRGVTSMPVANLKGNVAPIDYAVFRAIHKTIVISLGSNPKGVWQDHRGHPFQSSGAHGGPVSYTFKLTDAEAVESVFEGRAWAGRDPTAAYGPLLHRDDGAIACVKMPVSFRWDPRASFRGVTASVMCVKLDTFVMDIEGTFHGLENANEEDALANQLMLTKHASRLRHRGAAMTAGQVATIDLYMAAALEQQAGGEELEPDESA